MVTVGHVSIFMTNKFNRRDANEEDKEAEGDYRTDANEEKRTDCVQLR